MFRKILSYFVLPLLLLLSNSSGNSAPQLAGKSPEGQTGTREKLIVASGTVAMELDLDRLRGIRSEAQESKRESVRFEVSANSFFTIRLFNGELRDADPGSMELLWGNSAVLPEPLNASSRQLVLERTPSGGPFELVIRDGKTGFAFFNIEGHLYEYDPAARSLSIKGGRLLVSEELANKLGRPAEAGVVVGEISIVTSMYPIEVTSVVNGAVQSSVLPPRRGAGPNAPEGVLVPGPDIIVGDMPGLAQFGSTTDQVGLAMGGTSCNNGDVPVHFYQLPDPDHSVVTQNLYRMSGGPNNNERMEQIGQGWNKHTFGAAQDNSCSLGCTPFPDQTELGPGCSDPYSASQNAFQGNTNSGALGSRAWINPFTGAFPVSPRPENHTGHTHTGTSHRILVNKTDLNTTMNVGATYYAEMQYDILHEYTWCQSHPGQCNMYNNASYRRYNVSGMTSFTFAAVGAPVRMTPATGAWTGATSSTIEPAPGVDGRAFVVYKVTGPVAGIWHYEYAIHNQNLDRSIQSFSVPLGCGITLSNIGFHAPPNHPGFPNDGTVGDAGFSNAAWTSNQTLDALSWNTETFAQNPNANAVRFGTMYNFRFDSDRPPQAANATIGFFKTGTPITVGIQGPSPDVCTGATPTPTPPTTPTPTPTPSATATVTPTATPSATATPTSTPTPTVTPTPSGTPCGNVIFAENFDGVIAPALPPGWTTGGSGNGILWVTSTIEPDTAPNCAFVDDQAGSSDKYLTSPPIAITSAAAQLSFRNYFNTEFNPPPTLVFYDGGVLEVSSININAGFFTDVTDPAVGGSFVTGGYTGEINSTGNNPLSGRMAWSGNSGGYINTVINLGPNLNGQTVRLRFRMGTDLVESAPGWRVDTLSITGCPGPSPTPTPPTTPTPTPTLSPGITPSPSPTPPTPTPTPPPATATPIPTPCGVTFSENFDGVTAPNLPAGWTTTLTGMGFLWTTAPGFPSSGPNAAFARAALSNIGDSRLISPIIAAPSAGGILSFQNLFNLQDGRDGVVLEISVNGGAYADILSAGGTFVTGGYTDIIASGDGSPIAGRMAWSGLSAGSAGAPMYITSTVNLPAAANGQNIQLRWRLATDSVPNPGLDPIVRLDSIILTPASCESPTPSPSPTVSPTPTPAAQPLNLSTRMRVQTGDNVGIGGFIITGSAPKHVLLRAVGPSLTQFGVPNVLADPVLELHGPAPFATVNNDNWGDDPVQQAAILATGIAPTHNLEAAIDTTLNPGAYTAVVRGKNNTSGVGLIEVYDLSQSVLAKLANISTRALIDTGDNVVIAGFILGNHSGNSRIVLRGIGPSLTAVGVSNALANPTLELRDGNGALLIANNDWQDNPAQMAELIGAGLAPAHPLESAIAAALPPGLYTVVLAGFNNGTGVGLVEAYDLGP